MAVASPALDLKAGLCDPMAVLFPLRLVQFSAHNRLPVSIVDLYEADSYHVRVKTSFCELFPNPWKKEQEDINLKL